MGIREDEKIAPHCEFIHVHDKVVKRVMDVMPEGEELQNLAEFFRVFGDSTRIRILYALSQSELCVCDIASLLGMGQSAISHQLRILKQMRLVKWDAFSCGRGRGQGGESGFGMSGDCKCPVQSKR